MPTLLPVCGGNSQLFLKTDLDFEDRKQKMSTKIKKIYLLHILSVIKKVVPKLVSLDDFGQISELLTKKKVFGHF